MDIRKAFLKGEISLREYGRMITERYLDDLKQMYQNDELVIDFDDPRSYRGLTDEEVKYITGEYPPVLDDESDERVTYTNPFISKGEALDITRSK